MPPPLLNSFFGVPVASLGVVDADEASVVRPRQFKTQCVANWEKLKELTHIAQVADIKPCSKLLAQALGQLWQHLLAIGRSLLPALFVFHNHAADLPIGLHHGGVDGLTHRARAASSKARMAWCRSGGGGSGSMVSDHETRHINYLI